MGRAMDEIDLGGRKVIVVQLVYFTKDFPCSEFRFYAPSDSWLSTGHKSVGELVARLPKKITVKTISERDGWAPVESAKSMIRDPAMLAIARAVVWKMPTMGVSKLDILPQVEPYDNDEQLGMSFWIVDSGLNNVLSVAQTLGMVRAEFEAELDRLKG